MPVCRYLPVPVLGIFHCASMLVCRYLPFCQLLHLALWQVALASRSHLLGGQRLNRCLTYIWQMFDICLTDVWRMFDRCLTEVWLMLNRCLTDVWKMFDIFIILHIYYRCRTYVRHMYNTYMTYVWKLYNRSMTEVWLMYNKCMIDLWLIFCIRMTVVRQNDRCITDVCQMYEKRWI